MFPGQLSRGGTRCSVQLVQVSRLHGFREHGECSGTTRALWELVCHPRVNRNKILLLRHISMRSGLSVKRICSLYSNAHLSSIRKNIQNTPFRTHLIKVWSIYESAIFTVMVICQQWVNTYKILLFIHITLRWGLSMNQQSLKNIILSSMDIHYCTFKLCNESIGPATSLKHNLWVKWMGNLNSNAHLSSVS